MDWPLKYNVCACVDTSMRRVGVDHYIRCAQLPFHIDLQAYITIH